jgi:uncharacterized Zn finger protein
MAFYGGGFPEYVPVAERKARAQKSVEKLRKTNPDLAPVVLTGTKLVSTWWGKSWTDNLTHYSDYSNRIARGRSYIRHGAVLDLQLTPGKVHALVQGSDTKPYQVELSIKPLSKAAWAAIVKACTGKLNSLQELLEGNFPAALADLFQLKGKGLFPGSRDITLHCSCPDSARMCKHVAAVLFGIGVRLDDDPGLFFQLRQVNVAELITETTREQSQNLLNKSKVKSRRVIADADMSSLFGIDLETDDEDK